MTSVLRHEERDKSLSLSYYADPTPNVRHISWCLRSQFISAGRDPKKLNSSTQWPNPQLSLPSWSNPNFQLTLFQNPQILRTIFSGHDVIHTPALFPVWDLSWQMVIVISFAHERKTVPNDYALWTLHPNSSKPNQTEW